MHYRRFMMCIPSNAFYPTALPTLRRNDTTARERSSSLLRVDLGASRSRRLECLRRVLLGHIQLNKLQLRRGRELVIREQLLDLLLRPDLVRLVRALFGAERRNQILVLPGLDVIVALLGISILLET